MSLIKGRLRSRGRGYQLVPLGGGRPVRARGWSRVGARDGDLVLAERSGDIVGVLHRGERTMVGTVQRQGEVRLQRGGRRVYVARKPGVKLRAGQRVLVTLPETPRYTCELDEILGLEGEVEVEVEAALEGRGFHRRFPKVVEEEAEEAVSRPRQRGGEDRAQLDSLFVVTIDPVDAQDFDDGLSVESLGDGGLRLGVHIADVSHYVASGGRLDREAFRRAFSVYPPGGVVPMLPEKLSKDECSLLEGRPRRSFSVFLDYDKAYRLRAATFSPSFVQNKARLTYGEAQDLLDRDSGRDRAGQVVRALHPLTMALRRRRAERGGLDLDTGEATIVLDDQGHPSSVDWSRRLASHNVVEECMIAANRAVAARLRELGWPAIYRVHRRPTVESLERLADMLAPLGYQLRDPRHLGARDLQDLLDRVRGSSQRRLVSYMVLRSLPKALYNAANEGHYGLALERYLHFTSPIRRYADLVVHRFLKAALDGRAPGSLSDEHAVDEIADVCSYREELALEAERDVQAVYVTAYMKSRLGERFRGLVVGVEPFGVFVELDELPVQGMVPIEEFPGIAYTKRRRGARRAPMRGVELGRELTVRVARADVARRHVEFSLS